MSLKRITNEPVEASSSKTVKDDKPLLDDLIDDIILQILQLLELRHAVHFARSSKRLASISARNYNRQRRTYRRLSFEKASGCLAIHFDVTNIAQTISLSNSREGFNETIRFGRIDGMPEFELVTKNVAAQFQRVYMDEMTLQLRCEIRHGSPLDAAATILASLNGMDDCHCVDLQEEAVICLPSHLKKLSLGSGGLGGPHPVSLAAILNYIEKTPSLKVLVLAPAKQFSGFFRDFFENPAVQRLSEIWIHGYLRVELEDAMLWRFLNTHLNFKDASTDVTWQGLRNVIEAWRRNEIPTPSWIFNIRTDGEDKTSTIWEQLLGEIQLSNPPQSKIQYIAKLYKTATKSKTVAQPDSKEAEILAIQLLDNPSNAIMSSRTMQKISLTARISWPTDI